MIQILKKHTTSAGNKLEFYVTTSNPKTLVVRDNSCQIERSYTIGTFRPISFEDQDKPRDQFPLIQSFDQVIKTWTDERVHF